MIKFTDEMKECIQNAYEEKKHLLMATASKDGKPTIGFRGSTFVWDDEHLGLWDRSRKAGSEHTLENPHVVFFYYNPDKRLGWRFYGEAKVYTEGEVRQEIMERAVQAEVEKDPERKGYGVLIRVDKILRYSGEAPIQER